MNREALLTAAAITLSACGGRSKPAEGPVDKAGESAVETRKEGSDKPGDVSNDTKEKVDELKEKANPEQRSGDSTQ